MESDTRRDVTDYGSTGDTDGYVGSDTDAFQAAIDDCAEAGGGTVFVPPGTYGTGTLEFDDDVTLHLASGAVVRASHDETDYEAHPEYTWPADEKPWLRFRDCRNVTIQGEGTLDGGSGELFDMETPLTGHSGEKPESLIANAPHEARQGEAYLDPDNADYWPAAVPEYRPGPALFFERCEDVSVRDVTITDMPAWTMYFLQCSDVAVSGMTVDNDMFVPNSDGIAIDGSRNVRVSDCVIQSADDNITPQVDRSETACENVTVTNCTLRTNACGVKVGSETAGDVRNLTVSNCTITASNRGVGIQHRDGGTVENILFSDLVIETALVPGPWWGKGEPIYVTSLPRDAETDLGAVRNVRVTNVVATSDAGAVVYGSDDATLEAIRLDGVRIQVTDSEWSDAVGGNLDLQPTAVTAPIVARDLPAIYCRGVSGLDVLDCVVGWDDDVPDYHTHALEIERASDVSVSGFRGAPAHPETNSEPGTPPDDHDAPATIHLQDVTGWRGHHNRTAAEDQRLLTAIDVSQRH